MSVSLDSIWDEPLAGSPQPPATRTDTGARHIDERDDEESVFRPTKRRKSELFLGGSDEEDGVFERKSPLQGDQARPDIDALFEDLEEPSDRRTSKGSKQFDLAALRRDAQARAEKSVPQSSYPQYAVHSSSPPRDGPDELVNGGKSGPDAADDTGPSKRRTFPKLDEDRLLGKEGFSALIQACREFKPKGKGHELADLNRLFSMYQFWTHKLYPRTQFSDTVNRIEKLCHSKRMHSALLGWRDEFHGTINGKKLSENDDIDMQSDDGEKSGNEERRRQDEEDVFGPRVENNAPSAQASSSRASSAAPEPSVTRPPSSASRSGDDVVIVEDDDPFDIDALLREEEEMRHNSAMTSNPAITTTMKAKGGSTGRDFTFNEDNYDAFWAELRDDALEDDPAPTKLASKLASNPRPATSNGTQGTSKATSKSASDWEDDEAWDLLDEMERDRHPTNGNPSAPLPEHNSPKTGPELGSASVAPIKQNGSAADSGTTTTPSKLNGSNGDDWDDMYV